MNGRGVRGEVIYRAALRLLPRDFRERNTVELLAVFRARVREAGERSGVAAVGSAAREVADVVKTAGALRVRAWNRRRREDGMTDRGWMQDLKLAWRTTLRRPLFTATAAGTLALGMGATIALFGVVYSVLLAPLPYEEPDDLVLVWQNDRATGTEREPMAAADYYDFLERSRSFESLAAGAVGSANLVLPDDEPRRVRTAVATANVFAVYGVEPVLGRSFLPDEQSADPARVAILTRPFHEAAFDGDRDVLGETVSLDGEVHTVVGVVPELPFPSRDVDLWVPAPISAATSVQRYPHWLTVVGRLGDDTDLATARAEATRIAADLEAEFPLNANRGAFVEPLETFVRSDLRATLWVLFAGTGLFLLVACANVANLLLARATARGREVAVHAALGAGGGRIARRFVFEGLFISAAAGVVGAALGAAGLTALERLVPPTLSALGEARLDPRAMAFTITLVSLVGVGFGLVPALRARSMDLRSGLSTGAATGSGGRSAGRTRDVLVVLQIALAAVLLVGGALVGRTLWNLQRVDPGFEADRVLRVSFLLPSTRYPRDFAVYPDWPEVHTFHRELLRQVQELPGVRAAAVALDHPLDPGSTNSFRVEGRPPDPDQGEMDVRMVSPGYFETVGLDLVEGRLPTASDDTDAAPILLLNRTAVRRHFPDGDALGQRLSLWTSARREVIGIVEDERMHGLTEDVPPAMYVNILQAPPIETTEMLMVRTAGEPTELLPAVRRIVRDLDPQVALFDVSTLDRTLRQAMARERFVSLLLGAFGGVALLLAVLGVHGVLSYVVAQRRGEIGVRMALGATAGDVVRRVVGRGMRLVVLGVLVGLAAAWSASDVVSGLLYEVEPTDPWTYLGVAVTLAVVGLAAAASPANRAARTAPSVSLRAD